MVEKCWLHVNKCLVYNQQFRLHSFSTRKQKMNLWLFLVMTSVLPDDSIHLWGWKSAIFKEVMAETQTMISCPPTPPTAPSSQAQCCQERIIFVCLWLRGFLPSPPTVACLYSGRAVDGRTNRNSTGWVQTGHQLDWPWQSPPPALAQPPRCLITCTH